MIMSPADRYVAWVVGRLSLLVLLGLLLLSATWRLVEEGPQIGWLVALLLEFLLLPATFHEYTPLIALCGVMLGLAALAQHNELIALRASGYSPLRITAVALLPGLLLSAVAVALSFEAVPWSLRQDAATGGAAPVAKSQLWRTADGHYLHIGALSADARQLRGFTFYQIGADHRLQTLRQAERGHWTEDGWQLPGLREQQVVRAVDGEAQLRERMLSSSEETSLPAPHSLLVAALPPAQMPLLVRWREAQALNRRFSQGGARHWLSCWRSLLTPLTTVAWVVLVAGLLFGAQRQINLALRAGGGILIGILCGYVQTLTGTASVALGFSPLIGVVAVPSLCLAAGLWLLGRRV